VKVTSFLQNKRVLNSPFCEGKDATMSYATRLLLVLTSLRSAESEVGRQVQEIVDANREQIESLVLQFALSEMTPASTFAFESQLDDALRELGRQLVEGIYNALEPDDPSELPHDVRYEAAGYRRLNGKTRNRYVSTLFGTIELRRYGYRYWHRGEGEKTIFPLEIQLGLVRGASPALAEAAARYMADTGATQAAVLARLKRQHQVSWGAERLRDVTAHVSQAMDQFREDFQVLKILELLEKADRSQGTRKAVLSVGRDGISLCDYRYRFYEVATAATVTVYDRSGKRLGTVYLAFSPQLGQERMTQQLSSLIRNILQRWQGPLPRLTYVTDAGENETKYYRTVLRRMTHPRTGERLHWYRIVDYYHTSERIWTMAWALFAGDEKAARSWAVRMCRLLKKPNGPSRVLHAAAAMRNRRSLSQAGKDDFQKASNYIRRRTKFMQYAEYTTLHLPIGSGVTEAACKTIFTQRLKLSGMRWTKSGAQTILNLRVLLLSGIWDDVYTHVLESHDSHDIRTYETKANAELKTAA
jgi:hypothetical protein